MIETRDGYYVWKKGTREPLSDHFNVREFQCNCTNSGCIEQLISMELVNKLEEVRKEYGSQVGISSGYRCHYHQQELRDHGFETAKGTSQHELGNAADLVSIDKETLHQICLKHFDAVGFGAGILHVDTRHDKVRRWTYYGRQ